MTAREVGADEVVLRFVLADADRLVAIVAEDVGESLESVRPTVEHVIRLLEERAGREAARAEMVAAGVGAATAGVPRAVVLDRYLSTGWAVWEAAIGEDAADRKALAALGTRLLHGVDETAAALAEGYATVDRETVERDTQARLAFLDELLSLSPTDAAGRARVRRLCLRYGLEPDADFQLVAVGVGDRSDPQVALDLAHALRGQLGPPSAAERDGTGIRLPQVFALHGWLVLFARAAWPGSRRMREVLPHIVEGPWTAIVGEALHGVEALPASLSRLIAALRTAERLGHRSWVEHPDDMAIEELLLLDPDLLRAVVQRELGPLLSDARMGEELLETLQAYVDAGSNKREVARRLHVAARTVAYRIERIEELLGVRLEGPALTRLSVALLAHRLLGGSTP